jgi:hypothetical protein
MTANIRFSLLFSLLLSAAPSISSGTTTYLFSNGEVQKELDAYAHNPQTHQEQAPLKKDKWGNLIGNEEIAVPPEKKFALRRFGVTNNNSHGIVSEPNANDSDKILMEDGGYIETISQMDGYRTGMVSVRPWSDDYWAYYRGGASARYADRSFPNSQAWETNFRYISSNPFTVMFTSGDVDSLSPTEKYDLLYDGQAGALTQNAWADGEHYYRSEGKVETWMGLCHGWAPAAYLAPRPSRAVTVTAFDGSTKIKFYPADLKALTTLLWANARLPLRNVGGRCNERTPSLDLAGRPVNPACLDNNPATWHRAVVNRVGLAKRSFVMDSTWDFQVWNQPIISYKYRYFSPQTNTLREDLRSAMVPVGSFSGDRLKRYRARGTSSVIGISMELTYGMERRPDHAETDGPQNDQVRTVLYNYDLELDANGVVIGGEWHKKLHPDFLWTPNKDARPLAADDQSLLGEPLWNGQGAIPSHWQQKAKNSAARGQPLAKIIDSLLAIGGR